MDFFIQDIQGKWCITVALSLICQNPDEVDRSSHFAKTHELALRMKCYAR